MAIESFSVGSYAATYNSVSTGLTKTGYEITHDMKAEMIDKSDLYGDTMLDYIWRGANVSIDFTCLAFTKGSPVLMPFTAALYTLWATATPIGQLATDVAKSLVLTVTANTPSATLGPSTITASKAIIAPGYSTKHLYDNRLRELPLRLQLFPYSSTGTLIFAVTT